MRSDIAHATASTVTVHGLDLVGMLGEVSLGDFAYLELFGRLPDPRESRMFNAIVVALVEHGLTPSALVTRLTALGAPESLQSAVAAGLLGLGNTFVGTIEGAARLCQTRLPQPPEAGEDGPTDHEVEHIARSILDESKAAGTLVPGLGHPVHKPVDPRAEKLFHISAELGLPPAPVRLMRTLSRLASEDRGRELPVNVTGAIGATCSQLGVPWEVARGLGVMGRAIGLVGHLLEERRTPIAATVWARAEREVNDTST
ncbi:citryl-CoA lyase [Mycobacterium sp. AT1]|nr:citryl-CoA lyase [Mycobacterium sp. AT1]